MSRVTLDCPAGGSAEGLAEFPVRITRRIALAIGGFCAVALLYLIPLSPSPFVSAISVIASAGNFYIAYRLTALNRVASERLMILLALAALTAVLLLAVNLSGLVLHLGTFLLITLLERDRWWRRGLLLLNAAIFGVHLYRFANLGPGAHTSAQLSTMAIADVLLVAVATAAVLRLYAEYERLLLHSAEQLNDRLYGSLAECQQVYADTKSREEALLSIRGSLHETLRQRRATLAKLEASREKMEQFTYAASHDLKEPIRTTRSFMQFAAKQLAPKLAADTDLAAYFRHIETSTASMHNLLERLLLFSRAGRVEADYGEVDLTRLLARACALAQQRWPGACVTSSVGEDIRLTSDATVLANVLEELLDNACKFVAPGATARVTVTVTDTYDGFCRFEVADGGIGVDVAYREQVFGLFKRLNERSTYAGAGVGLALVRRLVTVVGGQVRMGGSEGGATAVVEVPIR